MIVIGIYENHIVINGQWYIANDKFCEQLSVLGVKLVGPIFERIPGMNISGYTKANPLIVEVSDGIQEKIINLVRNEFIINYGLFDGEKMSALKRDYIKSVPESERINVSWTLDQISFVESQRLVDMVKERIPDWQNGQPFERSIFSDVPFAEDIH